MASTGLNAAAIKGEKQFVPPPPPPEGPKIGRLAHLDALRGIAAFLVVIQHTVTLVARLPTAPAWFNSIAEALNTTYFSPGRMGVVVFFLISGFVVPFSLREPRALRSFAISRFFRLYPAYWLSLIMAVVLFGILDIERLSAKQVLANVTMLQFALRQPDVVGAYWTLFLEMAFYFCAALWFYLGRLKSERFLFGVICALMLLGTLTAAVRYVHPTAPLPVGYVCYIATMHLGTLARLAMLEGNARAQKLLPVGVGITLALTAIIQWLAYSNPVSEESWIAGTISLFIAFALFFYVVINRSFVNSMTIFLGSISYSYYLIHGILLHVGERLSLNFGWIVSVLIVTFFTVPLSMIISAWVYRFVERPAVGIGHKLMRRLHDQPAK